MFVHHVFFWLKETLTQEEIQKFEAGVKSLLPIQHVAMGDVGKPAKTNRPVIDSTYSYSLMLHFDSQEQHDAYQVDPIHEKFVADCNTLWDRVLIYDSESI